LGAFFGARDQIVDFAGPLVQELQALLEQSRCLR
jgi:hypothetical protein